jgi:hypothetical protein
LGLILLNLQMDQLLLIQASFFLLFYLQLCLLKQFAFMTHISIAFFRYLNLVESVLALTPVELHS